MNVNLVVFAGRVGNHPELKTISDKLKVIEISLAVNKRVKNKSGEWEDKTIWLKCKAYNGTAEIISKYVSKGDMLHIQGSLDVDTYDNKEGVKQFITFVQVDSVQLFPKSKGETSPSSLPQSESTQHEPEEDDSSGLPF